MVVVPGIAPNILRADQQSLAHQIKLILHVEDTRAITHDLGCSHRVSICQRLLFNNDRALVVRLLFVGKCHVFKFIRIISQTGCYSQVGLIIDSPML